MNLGWYRARSTPQKCPKARRCSMPNLLDSYSFRLAIGPVQHSEAPLIVTVSCERRSNKVASVVPQPRTVSTGQRAWHTTLYAVAGGR